MRHYAEVAIMPILVVNRLVTVLCAGVLSA